MKMARSMFSLQKLAPSYKDKTSNKVIRHYADSSLGNKCYHYILSFYFQKIPQDYKENAFYLRPCSVTPEDHSEPWFMCQPMERNTLDSMVARMFEAIGVKGKTNHSLGVTGTTRLFNAQVPKQIVQERSGHCSLDSLRRYERTSKEQHQAVSSILSSASRLPFTEKENLQRDTHDVKPDPDSTSTDEKCTTSTSSQSFQPTFTGCNNCTINVNFH